MRGRKARQQVVEQEAGWLFHSTGSQASDWKWLWISKPIVLHQGLVCKGSISSPKQYYQPGKQGLNTWAYGRHLSSKPQVLRRSIIFFLCFTFSYRNVMSRWGSVLGRFWSTCPRLGTSRKKELQLRKCFLNPIGQWTIWGSFSW